LRVFKNNRFGRFARKNGILDKTLLDAVARAERGQIDADLGGGVIKQRVARTGEGKRGGYRTLILYRSMERAFFVYGFAKNEMANITSEEKEALRKLAALVLALPNNLLDELLVRGDYEEVTVDVGQNDEANLSQ
jgi:hypothetical protein